MAILGLTRVSPLPCTRTMFSPQHFVVWPHDSKMMHESTTPMKSLFVVISNVFNYWESGVGLDL